MKKINQKGFTLLEILITCTIIAILAAVVYPSYQRYTFRAHRVNTQSEMVDYAARAERFRSANNTYTGFALPSTTSPRDGATRYNLRLTVSADAFSIRATPTSNQTKDECGTLTINQAGQRTNSTGERSKCW